MLCLNVLQSSQWVCFDLEAWCVLLEQGILLVLAAGWNTEDGEYNCLDSDGHCWRKTELVALAELCALNGLPFSSYHAKFEQLLNRCDQEHISFIFQNLSEITRSSVAPHFPKALSKPTQQLLRKSTKRPREKTPAEELSELTGVPVDTAESIVATAGSVAEALKLPMFLGAAETLAAEKTAEAFGLVAAQSIDLEDAESPGNESSASNPKLAELLSMGFPPAAAESALQSADGNLSQAIEALLSTWSKIGTQTGTGSSGMHTQQTECKPRPFMWGLYLESSLLPKPEVMV